MNFGQALHHLENADRVTRKGWNGMWLYLVPEDSYPARAQAAIAKWGAGELVPYRAYIAMKTVDGSVVPWVASQTDILAKDYYVVED